MKDDFFISLVCQVFDGYSKAFVLDQDMYFQHFKLQHQADVQELYEKHLEIGLKRGLEPEEDILKRLIDDGLWTDEDENKILLLRNEANTLESTARAEFLNSKKIRINTQAATKRKEINKLLLKKAELVGISAEVYADKRTSDITMRKSIFKDKDLTTYAFTEEEFDSLENFEMSCLSKKFQQHQKIFSEENIQKSVLKPFFSLYLSHCESAKDFYNKAISDLTVYQLKLVLFGKIFFNIFQFNDDIPDNIREDPERLLLFSESKRTNKQGGFIKDDAAASAVFGASKEDMKSFDTSGKSLSQAIKEKGGKLSMDDLINLSSS